MIYIIESDELSKASSVVLSQCECEAENGNCSHCIGLLYLLCHYQRLGLKAVPPMQSKTSLPQTWHIPWRIEGLEPKPVHSLEICKVNPKKKPPKKKMHASNGRSLTKPVLSSSDNSKCAVYQHTGRATLSNKILRTISHSDVKESPFKFGQVPTGSVLSYQQKPFTYTGDIINHNVQQDFPELLLPKQHSHYNRVLNFAEHNLYLGMPLIELMLWN